MIGALAISVIYVMVFGEDVETETVPAPTMEVVEFERPLMAVMPVPPVLETLAGVQKLPFQLGPGSLQVWRRKSDALGGRPRSGTSSYPKSRRRP
jgi:hypothetical protein